jgi:hypothetical protein
LGAKPDHHCVIRDRGPIQGARSIDTAVGGRVDQRMYSMIFWCIESAPWIAM